MDYISIHVYGHMLSDDILRNIEQDTTMQGNREIDFGIDISTSAAIDYVWSSLRNDWRYYQERSIVKDPYGTRRSRDLMERMLQSLGYVFVRQTSNIEVSGKAFEIQYLCPELGNLPIIVIGDRIGKDNVIETMDKCSLDYRAKGQQRKRSAHATMLEYLNSTENVYGIISNGQTLRLIRNSGQLVKVTYIEFDLYRMLEEDKYTEFCLMFRLLHASRFRISGDEPCVLERWFNMSIESGNRIREGLSRAAQTAMETIGQAVLSGRGDGNNRLRQAIANGETDASKLNKELIRLIYRLLFLFIIEDRGLVYLVPDDSKGPDYKQICKWQEIYNKYYSASRLRGLSELPYLRQRQYFDLWRSLMDTFRLFENGDFGEPLGIHPLGGLLFDQDTLHYIKDCKVSNEDVLKAFAALNEFSDERGQRVKINYSSLDVEEFGSVYEGILEMQPNVQQAPADADWTFSYVGGLDRKTTSSYYTRPDLVQNLIRTTLEPVIKEKIEAAATTEEKVRSLLSMKVCDAASGSGHIVLAMARTIAWYVCTIRTGEDNPASLDYREALREVIQKCVYAVDINPDAVELCKVVLWIEGYCAGKPLSFLDSHIRCGNSVVGVSDLQQLIDGVPQEAFNESDVKKKLLDLNKEALKEVEFVKNEGKDGLIISLFTHDASIQNIDSEQISLARQVSIISAMPEETLEQEIHKKTRWEELMASPRVDYLRLACNIFTYSFYKQFSEEDLISVVDESGSFTPFNIPYTRTVYQALQEIKYLDTDNDTSSTQHLSDAFCQEVNTAAFEHRFFHWCIEFPEVFADNGGFDVMCGNPPWDKIKVEDKKWFAAHRCDDIVNVGTSAQRKKAIDKLQTTAPELYVMYRKTLADAEGMSRYARFSRRFKLTATGDIDLFPLFAEMCLSFSREAWGLVLPTGIAVNDSNKVFFSTLIKENRLISLFDFENREKLFDIDSRFKFCLLTAGKPQAGPREVKGGFYLTRLDHLLDPTRIYTLQTSDFSLLNPNTNTCPVFRTSRDAQLTTKIYRKVPVLINENTGENPWQVRFARMFDMSNDSHLFRTYHQLTDAGATQNGNTFILDGVEYVPLYEGKMIWHYNHHYGTWPTNTDHRPNVTESPTSEELSDPESCIMPWYWVPLAVVKSRLRDVKANGEVEWEWELHYTIGFRDITNATNERTFVSSIVPAPLGMGNKIPTLFSGKSTMLSTVLNGILSSIVFDFITRQKQGGTSMNFFIVKQLPVLTPEQFTTHDQQIIVPRVMELTYFNHDLDGWAEELWEEMDDDMRSIVLRRLEACNGLHIDAVNPKRESLVPFRYQEDRRAKVQAELDAIFAHLYGLTTENLRYILDPEDVCGKGCINETFRVLKDNETRKYGEYRTKRLVLAAWNEFGYDN